MSRREGGIFTCQHPEGCPWGQERLTEVPGLVTLRGVGVSGAKVGAEGAGRRDGDPYRGENTAEACWGMDGDYQRDAIQQPTPGCLLPPWYSVSRAGKELRSIYEELVPPHQGAAWPRSK